MSNRHSSLWLSLIYALCASFLCAEDFRAAPTEQPAGFIQTLPIVVAVPREAIVSRIKIPVSLTVTEVGGITNQGAANIWIRGSSSAVHSKKPYRLEFRDEVGAPAKAALLGMPRESDWILYPAYSDKTMMR